MNVFLKINLVCFTKNNSRHGKGENLKNSNSPFLLQPEQIAKISSSLSCHSTLGNGKYIEQWPQWKLINERILMSEEVPGSRIKAQLY